MNEMYKYSSIGQYRNLVKDIEYQFDTPPKLTFTGTVKVHGSNSSVVVLPKGDQYAQSRNHIITLEKDNLGFAAWHGNKREVFANLRELLMPLDTDTIVLYGEFAGKGIQKGVAVSQVDKFFYLFGVQKISLSGDKQWLKDYINMNHYLDIIDAKYVWKKTIEIDFSNPKAAQNKLMAVTESVEAECPVGKYLGVSGVGEGVVWEHITELGAKLSFKVKGEKHSVTRVKKLAEVDTEKLNSVNAFIEYAVTENRLKQAFFEVCGNNADRRMLGKFIKWVSTDVHKEEADVLNENELTMKDIGRPLSNKAKTWFFEQEEL